MYRSKKETKQHLMYSTTTLIILSTMLGGMVYQLYKTHTTTTISSQPTSLPTIKQPLIKKIHQAPIALKEKTLIEHVFDESYKYSVDPYIVLAVIKEESEWLVDAKNGDCVGLMQVNKIIHESRRTELKLKTIDAPKDNITLGIHYISELQKKNKGIILTLMKYNMNHKDAESKYNKGETTYYARKVINTADDYRRGVLEYGERTERTKK